MGMPNNQVCVAISILSATSIIGPYLKCERFDVGRFVVVIANDNSNSVYVLKCFWIVLMCRKSACVGSSVRVMLPSICLLDSGLFYESACSLIVKTFFFSLFWYGNEKNKKKQNLGARLFKKNLTLNCTRPKNISVNLTYHKWFQSIVTTRI